MRVVYVVLSHRNPEQVLRLVRALCEGPAAHVLVRHSQSQSRLAAVEVEQAGGSLIEEDVELEWGGWSQLQLILCCLRRAAELDPDWTLVLSGQDYPLRPLTEIEADLAASNSDARLGSVREVEPHRITGRSDEFFLRTAYRHYTRPRWLPHLPHALRPLVYVRELPPLVGVRRLRPLPFRLHTSADWVTLGRRGLAAVLAAAEDRRLMRAFRRVAVPSECFFATVLLNEPGLRVERDHRRFIFFAAAGVPHPETLTSADLELALSSGADFARKFDTEIDPHVLERLDERRRSARPNHTGVAAPPDGC